MSFNQFRTNPGESVSKFKGRTETPRAWPGTAVSTWTNGGLMGGAGYEYEDSYHLLARNSAYTGLMNITNIPQTYRHLMLQFTMSQQSTSWAGLMSIIPNGSLYSNTFQPVADYAGSKGKYWGKGWSTGNPNSWVSGSMPVSQSMGGHSNWANSNTLCIYNYSDASQALKSYYLWSNTNSGNNSSYAGWNQGFGCMLKNTYTNGGAPSPAIQSIVSYNGYQNGYGPYQSYNLYGFGGLV